MQYGFLIDHDKCIGCHACTVACKAENSVPVGSFRTWVKYAEKGSFPDVKRHFAVLRCNHCTDAPCVTICPVNALEKRDDGIVDIDRDACIGCRACMQACPYDALYLNDDLGAVEKCHFCAHRVEQGLEPACAVVCPEQAIIAGDLHDPESKISLMVRGNETQVRRAEQGTGPNVHYKGAEPALLDPGSMREEKTYLWSDRPPEKRHTWPVSLPVLDDARVVLDTGHRVEWGWPVAAYLVTKGIAAGAAILAPFAGALGLQRDAAACGPEILGIVFLLATVALLIEDLAKPWAFMRLLTRPNWSSWLVKGGIVLTLCGFGFAASLGTRLLGADGLADGIRWVNVGLGVATACYTALLFAQCKGRDLWESRWLLPHLFVQAVMCGAAVLLPWSDAPEALIVILAVSGVLHAALVWRELNGRHATSNARQAVAFLRELDWGGVNALSAGLGLGVLVGLLAAIAVPSVAWVPVLAGLYLYEWAFVRAGQLPPLS